MARPLRVEFDGAWYHAMNRGAGQQPIFLSLADRTKFLDILADVSDIFRIEIHAYCLMGNHYHLLLRTPDGGLGRAMRHLSGVYTQYLNRRTGQDGPLFRGRYRAILIDSDAYQLQVSRYIHLNPVDAGVTDRPEAYVHSSYRAYIQWQAAPNWLVTTALLQRFGPRNRRHGYRLFVEQGIDAEIRAFYDAKRMKPVFGGDSFKAKIRASVEGGQRHTDREIPDARRLQSRPSLTEVAAAIAVVFRIDVSTLRSTTHRRGANNTGARGAALYLGRYEAGAPLSAIAIWLGYRSYNSAATALTRYRRRLEQPELLAKLHQVRSLLYKVET